MNVSKYAVILQSGLISLLNILVLTGTLALSRDQVAGIDAALVAFFGTIVTQTTIPKSQVPPPLGTARPGKVV